ncbi:MAG: hypothetical protein LBE50_03880 [Gallionellaceae bacterium]|jgi:hypothetical protein|nr:hypothetical protein [Gallionellaceae bacterium]
MKTETSTGGIGFFGALFLVLLTLRLTGHIDWSWWWVLSPLWVPAAVGLLILLVAAVAIFLDRR